MEKMTRERNVKERRARKLEKKQARAVARQEEGVAAPAIAESETAPLVE